MFRHKLHVTVITSAKEKPPSHPSGGGGGHRNKAVKGYLSTSIENNARASVERAEVAADYDPFPIELDPSL